MAITPPGIPDKNAGSEIYKPFASPINSAAWEWNDHTRFLEVTQGCSHNGCKFCTFFKNVPFAVDSADHILQWLEYLHSIDANQPIKRIFLQGANPFCLSYNRLMTLAEMIREYLPNVETIGSYCRISDLRDKTAEQLVNLREVGYDHIFIGVESGDGDLLARMNKGYGEEDLYDAGAKLNESGMTWDATFMMGLGGKGYGDRHAIKSAEFFNFATPQTIGGVSLTLIYDDHTNMEPPLLQEVRESTFVEAGEIERLHEMLTFVEHLKCHVNLAFEHSTMPYRFVGRLPDHRQQFLEAIEQTIEAADEEKLRWFRDNRVYEV